MSPILCSVAGSIHAHSSRLFRIDGHPLPYAWTHAISYDSALGRMPFLTQRLSVRDLHTDFDVDDNVLRYELTASIARGKSSVALVTSP